MATMPDMQSAFVKYEAPQGYSREDITILSGQNLARGTVLGKITASGKYIAYINAASDGSGVAAGVLLDAVDASAADAKGVAIVRHAMVSKSALVFGGSPSQGDKDAAYVELETAGVLCRTTA